MITILSRLIIILVFVCLSQSCSKLQLGKDVTKKYKLDLLIKHDKLERVGMIALPIKKEYELEFEASDKIDVLTFRTCSRELVVENPRVILNRKKYKFTYIPNEIERGESCDAEISVYNANEMHSVGYIAFSDSLTTLPAKSICGQYTELNEGLSVCQERASSMEKIVFGVEVIVSADEGCELEKNRGKEFDYQVSKGYCLYDFMEVSPPNRVHRLITYGYEDIQIKL